MTEMTTSIEKRADLCYSVRWYYSFANRAELFRIRSCFCKNVRNLAKWSERE